MTQSKRLNDHKSLKISANYAGSKRAQQSQNYIQKRTHSDEVKSNDTSIPKNEDKKPISQFGKDEYQSPKKNEKNKL